MISCLPLQIIILAAMLMKGNLQIVLYTLYEVSLHNFYVATMEFVWL